MAVVTELFSVAGSLPHIERMDYASLNDIDLCSICSARELVIFVETLACLKWLNLGNGFPATLLGLP